MAKFVLKNKDKFSGKIRQQICGTALGTKIARTYVHHMFIYQEKLRNCKDEL